MTLVSRLMWAPLTCRDRCLLGGWACFRSRPGLPLCVAWHRCGHSTSGSEDPGLLPPVATHSSSLRKAAQRPASGQLGSCPIGLLPGSLLPVDGQTNCSPQAWLTLAHRFQAASPPAAEALCLPCHFLGWVRGLVGAGSLCQAVHITTVRQTRTDSGSCPLAGQHRGALSQPDTGL